MVSVGSELSGVGVGADRGDALHLLDEAVHRLHAARGGINLALQVLDRVFELEDLVQELAPSIAAKRRKPETIQHDEPHAVRVREQCTAIDGRMRQCCKWWRRDER